MVQPIEEPSRSGRRHLTGRTTGKTARATRPPPGRSREPVCWRLTHALEDATPAHGPWPAPYLPSRRPLVDRKEDDLGPADQVLERHVANSALIPGKSRIARVIAVVAHHEIMARGHFVDLRVVEGAVVAVDLDDPMLNAARQRLQILRRLHRLIEVIDGVEGLDRFARNHLTVDDQPTVGDLDLVAGQANQTLDIVSLAIARQLEHDDVAALGIGGEDASGHGGR